MVNITVGDSEEGKKKKSVLIFFFNKKGQRELSNNVGVKGNK